MNKLNIKDIEDSPSVLIFFWGVGERIITFIFLHRNLLLELLNHNLIYVTDKTPTAAVSKLLLSEKLPNGESVYNFFHYLLAGIRHEMPSVVHKCL